MGLYLSKELLELVISDFKLLANGEEVKQGVTQDVSAIRHCLALDRVLRSESLKSVKLQHKTDPYLESFTNYVGDIVKLDQEGNYTTNFINDIKQKSDFGVGSNLLSSGVATHSLEKAQTYPKKANKGLIRIEKYEFSLLDDYINKLESVYGISRIGFSLLIWLNRFNTFGTECEDPEVLFNALKKFVSGKYSSELAELICFSDVEAFKNKYCRVSGGLLSENETVLKELFDVKSQNKENAIKDFSLNTSIPKPFLLLAGISGTGKTRFVRKQAEARGLLSSTYCLTSVRPDWHEPSDLLGYVSRLGGHAEYITTDVLTFMAQAWRAIADNENLNIECVDSDGQGKRLVVSGEAEALEDVPPYWLCLDEMNLAPVEQYFADYLSVLETREWCWESGDSFRYSCDALLKPSFLQLNGENGAEQAYNTKLRESLKLADSKYDDLWHCFCEYGLPIPFNLIVAGTVNMDETTHGFSRKVIDRAMSFDFGEFFPNEIDEFFESDQKKSANTLSYPILSHVRKIEEFNDVDADSDASKTKAFFKAINNVLKNTPFELAFRAFNELCLSVICFAPKTDTELAAVFDDYLMCKVLPRIEGDEDKVRTSQGHNLLEQLTEVLQEQLTAILPNHESISRPDLLRHFEGDTEGKVEVEWRSEKKLKAMTAQLNNGFCSFWP
ncbi:McrB family protein [Vibrio cholerae]|uniref:McrB family protein n=1 Tax=Vibrio cholerae TaxID=666 RepID=UPI001F37C798|nr:hypothetical protein [Vibrio cholerae]